MDYFEKMVDPASLRGRQEELLRRIKSGGADEIAKSLAILSLLAEKVLHECEVNRKSLEFVSIPVAKGIFQANSLPSKLRILAESPIGEGAGFHQLEHDPDGVPFRWTGPSSDFSFELGLDRSSNNRAVLRMLKAGKVNGAFLERIKVYVDGRPVGCSFSLGKMPFIEFQIPKRETTIAGTAIFVECDVWSPVQEEGSQDGRILGLPFVELAIEPA